MDCHHAVVIFSILFLSLQQIYGKTECMQITGTLVCPQKPLLAGNAQIDLKDDDRMKFFISFF